MQVFKSIKKVLSPSYARNRRNEQVRKAISEEFDRWDLTKRPYQRKPLYRPKNKNRVAGVKGKSIFTA